MKKLDLMGEVTSGGRQRRPSIFPSLPVCTRKKGLRDPNSVISGRPHPTPPICRALPVCATGLLSPAYLLFFTAISRSTASRTRQGSPVSLRFP